MRKKGFTLVELMVSVAILMIIIGSMSLVITSFNGTYTMGVKNEETGNSYQTFYAHIIKDITPLEEENEENYIEVKVFGDPVEAFEIKRSWYLATEKEKVRYIYSGDEISRSEYRNWDETGTNRTRILKGTKNFDLIGMGLEVSKNPLENRRKISSSAVYESIEGELLRDGIRLGMSEDEDAEKYNYYIEPGIKLKEGSEAMKISRGYGFRFASPLYREEDEESKRHDFLIWCEKYTGLQTNGGTVLLEGPFNSPEDGVYIEAVVKEQSGHNIHGVYYGVDATGIELTKMPDKADTYYLEGVFPRKQEINLFVSTTGNRNRYIDIEYYVYKEE